VSRLREALLTAGAVVGTMCLLVALAGVLFGVKPLIFESGSMGPEIPAGAVGFARTVGAEELAVGDVVSVHRKNGERVTHRVVGTTQLGGNQVELTLRGDGNPAADAETYVVSRADRLFFSIPRGGQVVSFLGSGPGLFLLGGMAAGLVIYAFRPVRTGAGGRRRRVTRAAVAAPVVAAIVGSTSVGTSAYFTDTAAVNSGSTTAYTVPATSLQCGALSVLSTTFVWDAVPGATSYTLFYESGAQQRTVDAPATSTVVPNLAAAHTAWVVVNRNFGSTTWTSVASNTRTYYVLVVGVCS
jgi:signal peptidase I